MKRLPPWTKRCPTASIGLCPGHDFPKSALVDFAVRGLQELRAQQVALVEHRQLEGARTRVDYKDTHCVRAAQ